MRTIAVLIPTYKPGDYLESCLKSIDNQTLPKERFKVYMALNGPKQGYDTYIRNLLLSFSFSYELFYLEEASVSNARNYLIDNSDEPFIVFIDDDDLVSVNYLEELYIASDKTILGISNVKNFSNDISSLKDNYIGNAFLKINPIEKSKYKTRKYYSSPCAKMIHRMIIADTRFDINLSIGEDSLFMAELSHRVKSVRKTVETACYYVCEREGSATRKKIDRKKEFERITYLLRRYSQMLFSPHYDRIFIMTRIAATLKHIKRLI